MMTGPDLYHTVLAVLQPKHASIKGTTSLDAIAAHVKLSHLGCSTAHTTQQQGCTIPCNGGRTQPYITDHSSLLGSYENVTATSPTWLHGTPPLATSWTATQLAAVSSHKQTACGR
jgi:hypothetical protein